MDFAAMRSGMYSYTREEYEHLPYSRLNHIMGFFEGFRVKEEEERARQRWRNGV